MIDRWIAAGARPGVRLEGRAARVTALGVLLRRLRRASGESLAEMAARLGAQDLGLSPETLAAIERGDAAPPPGFEKWVAAGFPLGAAEQAALAEAMFLAADPFRAARASHDEIAYDEALRELARPVDLIAEEGAEAAKALLRARRSMAALTEPEAARPTSQAPARPTRLGAAARERR